MENENITKTVESNKNGKGILIALIISITITITLAGYICYDKVLSNSNLADKDTKLNSTEKTTTQKNDNANSVNENNDKANSADSSATTNVVKTRKCTGTYYGEAKGTLENGISYDIRNTFTLKDDGTFELNRSDISGTEGIYVIIDNTISLIGRREITGPREEAPVYLTSDYVIADDCSYILVNNGDGITFKAAKK